MSIGQTKNINANLVSSEYGVTLRTDVIECNLIYTITSIEIQDSIGIINLTTNINGIVTGNNVTYTFVYDKSKSDIIAQAENYLLSLEEFSSSFKI